MPKRTSTTGSELFIVDNSDKRTAHSKVPMKGYVKEASMFRQTLLVATFTLANSVLGHPAQPGTQETVSKLRGQDQKVWTFTRWESHLGDGSRCERGESWTFFRDGRLLIKRCEGHVISSEEKHWRIERKSQIDDILIVGDAEYLLLFPAKSSAGKEEMILRQKPPEKTIKTKDLLFYHEID